MPQLEYLGLDDLSAAQKQEVHLDEHGQQWRLVAVLIHFDRASGQETGRTAFLRRVGAGGGEWEIPLELLRKMARMA
ncbi:hypothetical protein ACFPK5_00445 [Streptomyces beijiangensis]|uniref:hypothetical protein n=1 Tax=Streptomyces beijiangensis TaxID=163361 RepID=UPI0031DA6535